ncbi:hypothetical protein BBP40_005883 [Aspergillus hancockii]|nr:hypothetical protein BBP40_005883 [Aspergillus hancockii]
MSLPYQDLEVLGASSSTSGGIVLISSDQWRTWYSTVKVTAKSLGVWKYLDPDASDPGQIPEEPRETLPGDAQEELRRSKISRTRSIRPFSAFAPIRIVKLFNLDKHSGV